MGVSLPASFAAVAAFVALAETAATPYQPMTPPNAKMSGVTRTDAADAKTVAPPSATSAAPIGRPYQPVPVTPTKTPPPAKPPAGKAATKAGAKPPVTTPAPAASAMIYVIRRTEDAWTVMDPNAVEKVPGGPVRRAYSVTVRRNLLNGGPPQPGYVRTLNEFDCDAMKFRWRAFTIYNRFGAVVVKQDNAEQAFTALGRGSEEEDIFRTVCDGGGGGSVVAAPSLGLLVIGLMQGWDEQAMTSAMSELPPPPEPKPPAKPGAKRR